MRAALIATATLALSLAFACTRPNQTRSSAPVISALDGGTPGGGRLSVLVVDEKDQPIQGAEVWIFCAADPPGTESCGGVAGPIYTSANGNAAMYNLPRGLYTVKIGSRDRSLEWTVSMSEGGSAGNTIVFDFTKPPTTG